MGGLVQRNDSGQLQSYSQARQGAAVTDIQTGMALDPGPVSIMDFFSQGSLGMPADTSGAGSQEIPPAVWLVGSEFIISTVAELKNFANRVNNNHEDFTGMTVILAASLHLGRFDNWEPIGGFAAPFNGTFLGNGFSITGLQVKREKEDYVGLFGYIGNGGVVQDLSLEGNIRGRDHVGGIAGLCEGMLQNCCVSGRVSGRRYVGGVAGACLGILWSSRNNATIRGGACVGGIAGNLADGSQIVGCCNLASVLAAHGDTGGIAGSTESANVTIADCYNTGFLTAENGFSGGIAGQNAGGIRGCHNTADIITISGGSGGIAGSNSGSIRDCVNLSHKLRGQRTGHIAGENSGEMSGCACWWDTQLSGQQEQEEAAVWTVAPRPQDWPERYRCSVSWNLREGGAPVLIEIAGQNPELPVWLSEKVDVFIHSGEDLCAFAKTIRMGETFSGKTAVLAADISLSGEIWNGIGQDETPFEGSFSGCGRSIHGLSGETGLFVRIGKAGVVRDVDLTCDLEGQGVAGCVARENHGIIENCAVSGRLRCGSGIAGGLCGKNYGSVRNCVNTAEVNCAGDSAGGIAGINHQRIEGCCNLGVVTGGAKNAGGIAGINNMALAQCASLGDSVQGELNVGPVTGNGVAGDSNRYWVGIHINGYNDADQSVAVSGDLLSQSDGWPDMLRCAPWIYVQERLPRLQWQTGQALPSRLAVDHEPDHAAREDNVVRLPIVRSVESSDEDGDEEAPVEECGFAFDPEEDIPSPEETAGAEYAHSDPAAELSKALFGWRVDDVYIPADTTSDHDGEKPPLESISLECREIELELGGERELQVLFHPEGCVGDRKIRWISSDRRIVEVEEDGRLTALAEGTVIIVAAAGDKTATCFVQVTGIPEEAAEPDTAMAMAISENEEPEESDAESAPEPPEDLPETPENVAEAVKAAEPEPETEDAVEPVGTAEEVNAPPPTEEPAQFAAHKWIGRRELEAMARDTWDDFVRTTGSGLMGLRASAIAPGSDFCYDHDTVLGQMIQTRVRVFEPNHRDILVSGSVKGAAIDKIQAFFDKWFRNRVAVVCLDHQGSFGQQVEVTARLDMSGFTPERLHFYRYHPRKNSYKPIENVPYKIRNGKALRFSVGEGGVIIVCDGPLSRK